MKASLKVKPQAYADLRLKLGLRAAGFVSAYRLEPIHGIGMSFIAFNEVAPVQISLFCASEPIAANVAAAAHSTSSARGVHHSSVTLRRH